MRRALLTCAGVAGLFFASAPAHADEVDRCIAAFDDGQRARDTGSLVTARETLLTCAREECPAVLRADCAGVLAQVEAATPTVVFAAQDSLGHDVPQVEIYEGATLVSRGLDARALPANPGKHTVTFVHEGTRITVDYVARDGEKNRTVAAVFPAPPPPPPVLPLAPPRPPPLAHVQPRRGAAGWVIPGAFAVLGVGGLVTAGATRLAYTQRVDDLRNDCAPACSSDDRDGLSHRVAVTNVSLGIGLGALAVAVAAFVLMSPPSESRVGRAW